MIDYTKYLTPISGGGYSCNGCGQPLEEGDLFCACTDCGAVYCEKCVKNGTFEAHNCDNE